MNSQHACSCTVSCAYPSARLSRDGDRATVPIARSLQAMIDALWRHAAVFFAQPDDAKARCARPGRISGYRRVGVEYAQAQDREDRMESFTFRRRDHRALRHDLALCSQPLYGHLAALQRSLDRIAQQHLALLASRFGAGASPIATELDSFLQLSFYRPGQEHGRDILVDRHEDAVLFTLTTATGAGLEVEGSDGTYRPAPPVADGLLAFAGSILTLVTGGAIPPVHHRVRRHPEQATRMALMYFVNPTVDVEVAPWVRNETNRGVDIAGRAAVGQVQFGLPAL